MADVRALQIPNNRSKRVQQCEIRQIFLSTCPAFSDKEFEILADIVKQFQQDATIAFILRSGFTLHVSGDNPTHHQEYNAVYGLSGRQVYCKLKKTVITIIFYTTANMLAVV